MSGFPKTIWRYWEQGWDKVPYVVQKCTESVKKYASDWNVIDLDKDNIENYIILPDFFKIETDFPIQTKSDYIRCALLQKYGGVWLDATVFLNKKLSDFIATIDSDFFCFFRHKYSAMSSWFLASKPDSYIINNVIDCFKEEIFSSKFLNKNRKYFNNWRGSPDYLIFHRVFERLIKNDSIFSENINKIPFVETFYEMAPSLFGVKNRPTQEMVSLIGGAPLCFKLAHHYKEEDCDEHSLLKTIFNSLSDNIDVSNNYSHLSISGRSILIWGTYANNTTYVKNWSGNFRTADDLRITTDKYSGYHVYNFSSPEGRNTTQLLVPVGDNRLFLRYQNGEMFSEAREVAYADEVRQLKEQIRILEEKLAVNSLKREAEEGDSVAQYHLGDAYRTGTGVRVDWGEALKWYRKSADKGNQHAQYWIGIAYLDGRDVQKNVAEAVKWFEKSAMQGNKHAQYRMGEAYRKGEGVQQNETEAKKWYKKSAGQGSKVAQVTLKTLESISDKPD